MYEVLSEGKLLDTYSTMEEARFWYMLLKAIGYNSVYIVVLPQKYAG